MCLTIHVGPFDLSYPHTFSLINLTCIIYIYTRCYFSILVIVFIVIIIASIQTNSFNLTSVLYINSFNLTNIVAYTLAHLI